MVSIPISYFIHLLSIKHYLLLAANNQPLHVYIIIYDIHTPLFCKQNVLSVLWASNFQNIPGRRPHRVCPFSPVLSFSGGRRWFRSHYPSFCHLFSNLVTYFYSWHTTNIQLFAACFFFCSLLPAKTTILTLTISLSLFTHMDDISFCCPTFISIETTVLVKLALLWCYYVQALSVVKISSDAKTSQ